MSGELILASGSVYRRELLGRFGLPFTAASPDVDESPEPDEDPAALAARLSAAKASALGKRDAIVIGSDQVASLDGRVLGKPGNRETALAQLAACQGRAVVFHTAVTVLANGSGNRDAHIDTTLVNFRRLRIAELERYVDSEPAFDCAGGFKVEGLGITLFESVESRDPTALIGLPLIWLAASLRRFGLDPLRAD